MIPKIIQSASAPGKTGWLWVSNLYGVAMYQAKVVSDCFIHLLVSPGSPEAAHHAQDAAALSAYGSHI